MENSLISLIIPTFDRADLIGATLDSIILQTFSNWECIVVDDSSLDYTIELMEFYCEKDCRIKFYQLPPNRPKGANSCRNYGFEKSNGEYIQWFDSDDLMVKDFLEVKLRAIEYSQADFVISKTINFKDPNPSEILNKNEVYYNFGNYELSHFNYVVQNINWLSPDLFVKRNVVGNIRFNEKLKSAQERNFFSKLTAYTTNGVVIDDYLTLRRIHDNSTQSMVQKEEYSRKRSYFEYCYETLKDLNAIKKGRATDFLLSEALEYSVNERVPLRKVFFLTLNYLKKSKSSAGWYFLYQISLKLFGRGIFFRRKFRRSQDKKINKRKSPREKFNILTRTSGRPKGFQKCRSSILGQSHTDYRHIVSYDESKDLDYLNKGELDLVAVHSKKDEIEVSEVHKPYNLYCNDLLCKVEDGWILFLDDDDMLAHKKVLKILKKEIKKHDEDTLFIWRTKFPDGSLLPPDATFLKKEIKKAHIDTACFMFHSKYKDSARWDPYTAADFRFIRDLAEVIPKQIWIDNVLTLKNNFGDGGNRNDIKI